MKKGFTLAELLGVIVIVSLIAFIVLPPVINRITESEKIIDDTTHVLIKEAANLYVSYNKQQLSVKEGNNVCVTIKELIENEFLKGPLKYADGTVINDGLYVGGTVIRGNIIDIAIEESKEPPSPTINGVPTNYVNSDVIVDIESEGSGVCSSISLVEYRINGGDWNEYNNPITIIDEGETLIEARSTTFINEVSSITSEIVRIDKTQPTCTTSGGSNTLFYSPRTITGTCSDAGGSGCTGNVSRTFSTNTDGNYSPGEVCDNAGNCRTCPTTRVRVKTQHTVTYISSSNGSVSPSTRTVSHGGSLGAPNISPSSGYVLDNFTVVSGSGNASLNSQTGALSNIVEDITIRANFIPEIETLTASTTTTVTSDGITGTIPQSGLMTSTLISGSPASSQNISTTIYFTRLSYHVYRNGSWEWAPGEDIGNPGTCISYNSGGYSGSLCGSSSYLISRVNHPAPSNPTEGTIWHYSTSERGATKSGTVYKPDTRVYEYYQSYEGTIYGDTMYEYRYNFVIDYRP